MDCMISNYLELRSKIRYYSYQAFSSVIKTKSVYGVIKGTSEPVNIYHKYIWGKFLCAMNKICNNSLDSLDDKFESVQIKKLTNTGEKTVILDSDENDITLLDIIDKSEELNELKQSIHVPTKSLSRLQLIRPDGEKVCIKKFMMEYEDLDINHKNTLRNIFKFNEIDVCDDTELFMSVRIKAKLVKKKVPVKDVLDTHINEVHQVIVNDQ